MSVKMIGIEDDGVVAIASGEELDGMALTADDNAALKTVLGDAWASKRVALDLSDTDYIDSATIGWLLSSHRAFSEAGGKLVIHSLKPGVKRVIELMRIHSVLDLTDDRASAMDMLRK